MKKRIHSSILGIVGLLLAAAMAHGEPQSQRVLFLVVHGFNRMEHFESLYSLVGMGYEVDVASFERGTILLDPDNASPDAEGRDAHANLAMREVRDISPYVGLVIPGGYSAGNMEHDREAIRIVRAFDRAAKPIGAICHAARLLAGAGVARGHVITGWNEIASEIPDEWVSGEVGTYIDQAVVVDGHIVSCRYPNDVGPWLQAFTQHLADRGGIRIPAKQATATFIAGTKQTGHLRQMTTLGARNNRISPTIIHNASSLANALDRGGSSDVVLVYPDPQSDALLNSPDGKALLAALGDPPVHRLAENPPPKQLREAVAVAMQLGHPMPEAKPSIHDAVIAVTPGFDDRVAIAMEVFLRQHGFQPAYISHERGWVRGLNGLPVFATGTYEQPPLLADRVLIVAPGGLWPREDPGVRQANQPDWLVGHAQRDARRAAWITRRYQGGDLLVIFGFDSLYLTGDTTFSGIAFAASDQTVWSFRNHSAGQFARDAHAMRSAERIFSARGFDALPELLRLLESPAAAALIGR